MTEENWRMRAINDPDFDLKIGVESLRRQFEYWLKWDEGSAKRDGDTLTDDSHIIPPSWPSRGAVGAWIAVLKKAEEHCPPSPSVADLPWREEPGPKLTVRNPAGK
jgi:hypothetical protein